MSDRVAAARLPPPRLLPTAPRGRFLAGNLREVRTDLLGFLTQASRRHGDLVMFRLGLRRWASVTHPELVEAVFSDTHSYTLPFKAVTRRVLGKGLVTSEGDYWLNHRRAAQPAFHRDRVVSYGDVMVRHALRLGDSWEGGQELEVHSQMMDLTMEASTRVLFHAELPRELEHKLERSLTAITDVQRERSVSVLSLPDWLVSPRVLQYLHAVALLDGLADMLVDRHPEGEPEEDLLALLLRIRDSEGHPLSKRQLRDEIVTFFLAGTEAAALTLAWTWHLLGQNPLVEAKLHDHLAEVLGGRVPTGADYGRLDYVQRVVKETMRLRPPAWGVLRQARHELRLGDRRIPGGTIVVLPQWVVHQDPRWYPEPEVYEPDRWLHEPPHRYAYFPFGGGQRQCIGSAFALMTTVLMLATLAQRFQLRAAPGPAVEFQPFMSLRPRHGIRMKVSRRDEVRPR